MDVRLLNPCTGHAKRVLAGSVGKGSYKRMLGQALASAALSGKSEEEAAKLVSTPPAEQAALGKLLANWRSLVESRLAADEGTLFQKAR